MKRIRTQLPSRSPFRAKTLNQMLGRVILTGAAIIAVNGCAASNEDARQCPTIGASDGPEFVARQVTGPVPTVVSDSGKFAAVLFGATQADGTLAAGSETKILWMSTERDTVPFSITQIKIGNGEVFNLGGPPGPSIVPIPQETGCLRTTIDWGDHSEVVWLPVS